VKNQSGPATVIQTNPRETSAEKKSLASALEAGKTRGRMKESQETNRVLRPLAEAAPGDGRSIPLLPDDSFIYV
jgi:hypothetical protein